MLKKNKDDWCVKNIMIGVLFIWERLNLSAKQSARPLQVPLIIFINYEEQLLILKKTWINNNIDPTVGQKKVLILSMIDKWIAEINAPVSHEIQSSDRHPRISAGKTGRI